MKLLVLIGWTLSFSAHAVLSGGGLQNSTRSSSGPEVTGVESTQTGAGVNCSNRESEEDGYTVSYRFIKTLVDQNVPEEEKVVVKKIRGTGNYRVEMNRYVSACTDFEYEIPKTGNNYFLSFKNKYKFSEDDELLDYLSNEDDLKQYVSENDAGELSVTDAWKSTPHDLKHELCLKSKGLVKNNTIDHEAASRNSNLYTRRKTFSTFSVNRGNGEESVNLYFASGVETDYVSEADHLAENISPAPDLQCKSFEHFGGEQPYRLWTSDKDKIIDRYRAACKRGDIEAMMRAQSELQNDNAGNFQGLLGQMNAITNQLTEQRANDIYATLEEINKELGDRNLDSDDVKGLVDEYLAEVQNLDRLVLEPAKKNIRENILNRVGKTRDAYENSVKPSMEILERFGRIAGGEHSNVHTALRNNLDTESAELFTDLVREGAEATSHYEAARIALNERRAKQYRGSDGADALENDINDQADVVVARFEREKLNPWRLQYRAYSGDVGVVNNAGASVTELETEINRGFMEFQQKEMQGYQQNCGRNMIGMVRNSYGCQQWQQRQQARMQGYMNQREAQLLRLKAAKGEFDTLKDVYNEYYRAQVARGDTAVQEDDGFGLVSLTSGQRRSTASELPTLQDGSPIEDYYSFRMQQQQMEQFNPMMMQQQPYMNPMHMQGQMLPMMQQQQQQMYMSPMFMQQQSPYMMMR